MAKVLIGIPNQGNLHFQVVESLLRMLMAENNKNHQVSIHFEQASPIEHCRNRIVADFLKGSWEYLLSIDSDNPPYRNALELANLGLDIVGCPTPFWSSDVFERGRGHMPIMVNAFEYKPEKEMWQEHLEKDGLQEVDAVGTGCIMIRREVLEKVRPAFVRVFDENGIVDIGSDLNFCKRAKDAGFRLWCHYDYPCGHWKTVNMSHVLTTLQWRDVKNIAKVNINTPTYWDKQWRERGPREYPYHELIVEKLEGSKVLDFGCGRGDLLAKLGANAQGMDISQVAVSKCRERGLKAEVGDQPVGWWDAIVATEVLEHLDDDVGMLERFFKHTDYVIYAVPHDCLPPGMEPEHRRIYTKGYCKSITPYHSTTREVGDYLVVEADRNGGTPATQPVGH